MVIPPAAVSLHRFLGGLLVLVPCMAGSSGHFENRADRVSEDGAPDVSVVPKKCLISARPLRRRLLDLCSQNRLYLPTYMRFPYLPCIMPCCRPPWLGHPVCVASGVRSHLQYPPHRPGREARVVGERRHVGGERKVVHSST